MVAAIHTGEAKGPEQKASAVDVSRVCWAFLSQYYSFLNKDPSRLHCFYTKRSTLIHSTEGDDVTPCYGQQEIHAKIMSLELEDCKVYISNVDSQSSAEGGIIVQVLGEQSNRGGVWRKFSQTFFLAEQPNGYFVLNDICRYIKEEAYDEEISAQPATHGTNAVGPTTNTSNGNAESVLFDDASFPPPSVSSGGVIVPNGDEHHATTQGEEAVVEQEPIPQAFGEFKADEVAAPAAVTPLSNGVAHHVVEEEDVIKEEPKEEESLPSHAAPVGLQPEAHVEEEPAAAVEEEPKPVSSVEEVKSEEVVKPEEPKKDEQKKEEAPAAVEAPSAPTPAPTESVKSVKSPKVAPAPVTAPPTVEEKVAPTPAPAAPAPTPAPAPAPAPAAPKSWASLAAATPLKSWGALAAERRGTSSAGTPPAVPSSSSSTATTTKAESNAAASQGGRPTLVDAVLSINTANCFVKGVIETVTDKALRDVLTTRFGPIREFDIIRSKACAFIEFERTDSARRAIQASMRPSDGGEGGIHIPVSSPAGATTVIHIVEKKNPGERPASRPHTRGGGAAGSGGRSQTGAPRSGGGGAGEEGGAGGRGQGQGQGAGRGGKTGGGGGGSGRGAKGSGGGASKSASASATTTGSAAK